MSKSKTFDITPNEWAAATEYQRGAAVAQIMRCSNFTKEVHITRQTLTVVCPGAVGVGGMQALANIVQSIVSGSKEEDDIQQEIAELCCGDTSCHFWPAGVPRGQTTNAGCRCFKDIPQEYRLKAVRLVQLYKTLAAQRSKPAEEFKP